MKLKKKKELMDVFLKKGGEHNLGAAFKLFDKLFCSEIEKYEKYIKKIKNFIEKEFKIRVVANETKVKTFTLENDKTIYYQRIYIINEELDIKDITNSVMNKFKVIDIINLEKRRNYKDQIDFYIAEIRFKKTNIS